MVIPFSYFINREAVCCSETVEPTYQSAWCQIPEKSSHSLTNLISRINLWILQSSVIQEYRIVNSLVIQEQQLHFYSGVLALIFKRCNNSSSRMCTFAATQVNCPCNERYKEGVSYPAKWVSTTQGALL